MHHVARYIAYDPQEDTETVERGYPFGDRGSYIAYDPQEDTETRRVRWGRR